jgi:hypothetical protein
MMEICSARPSPRRVLLWHSTPSRSSYASARRHILFFIREAGAPTLERVEGPPARLLRADSSRIHRRLLSYVVESNAPEEIKKGGEVV